MGPAIKIAHGFPATKSLCEAVKHLKDELMKDRGSRETYLVGDRAPCEGDVISFKGLAEALEIVKSDPRSFYEGEIAESIVDYVNSLVGVLELEDFKRYSGEFGDPLSIEYRGKKVYEMPPNTQGVTTLHILKLLEDFTS